MAGPRIPNPPPPKNNHPIALALDAFEKILDGCKELAATLVLDEFEAQELQALTEGVLALHAEVTDRITLDLPAVEGSFTEKEIADTAARVKTRVLSKFVKSGQENLEIMALDMLEEDDLAKC